MALAEMKCTLGSWGTAMVHQGIPLAGGWHQRQMYGALCGLECLVIIGCHKSSTTVEQKERLWGGPSQG